MITPSSLISAQEPFTKFSFLCPVAERSEWADLVGAWHLAWVNPLQPSMTSVNSGWICFSPGQNNHMEKVKYVWGNPGSLIQIKLRVPSTQAPQYFVKDSQQQSQPKQCKNRKLCQHFILPFFIFDILSGFDIPNSAGSRPGNYFPYILGKALKEIDGHLISYKYQFLGVAQLTAKKWPLQNTILDCL